MTNMHSLTDNPFATKKLRQDVTITLLDGTEIDCKLFVGYNERILDVLNDNRSFIPVEDNEGRILVIAKSSIMTANTQQITAFNTTKNLINKNLPPVQNITYEGISPYHVLELPDNSPLEKVRKRYLKIRELLNIENLEQSGTNPVMISLARLYLKQIEAAYLAIAKLDTMADNGGDGS